MNIPERIGVRFELRGRVQGVGCRAQVEKGVRALAAERGEAISGWVRNLSTGAVEVVVFAHPREMADLERFLRLGLRPPVRVDEVQQEELQDTEITQKNLQGFKVLRDPAGDKR